MSPLTYILFEYRLLALRLLDCAEGGLCLSQDEAELTHLPTTTDELVAHIAALDEVLRDREVRGE